MKWILKSFNQPIPGNYFYVQRHGIYHTFPAVPFIEEVAKSVSSFRIANKLPRANLAECLEDVDQFNCEVRNNDPKYCRQCAEEQTFESIHANHPFVKKSCASCGTPTKVT
jgi:hypothetical protein